MQLVKEYGCHIGRLTFFRHRGTTEDLQVSAERHELCSANRVVLQKEHSGCGSFKQIEETNQRQGIPLGVYGKILSGILVEMKEVIKERNEKLKQEIVWSRIKRISQ